MPFDIVFTLEAIADLHSFLKKERRHLVDEIESQLSHELKVETRNRKKLRPNQVAEWEIRIGKFRVFFDIDNENKRVKIEAVGYKKGNRLYIRGEEYEL